MKHTIGILGASDIAYKRFLPALEKSGDIGLRILKAFGEL